jgi:DNA-directed RNA polymerase subunit RPC12/RpoP
MAEKCQDCGRELADKSMLRCPRDSRRLLRKLRQSGYLQPLSFRTQDGLVRLAPRQEFLTLQDSAPRS